MENVAAMESKELVWETIGLNRGKPVIFCGSLVVRRNVVYGFCQSVVGGTCTVFCHVYLVLVKVHEYL